MKSRLSLSEEARCAPESAGIVTGQYIFPIYVYCDNFIYSDRLILHAAGRAAGTVLDALLTKGATSTSSSFPLLMSMRVLSEEFSKKVGVYAGQNYI